MKRLLTLVATVVAAIGGFTATTAGAAVPVAGTFHPLEPTRILDTRDGTGVADRRSGPLGAGQVIEVNVAGNGGVPSTGAEAATLNITITQAAGDGYATVWPCGAPRPVASSVNYVNGVDVANQVTVKLGTDGRVCIFASKSAQLIADVNGWWGNGFESAPGFYYTSIDPTRILDSRDGTGMPGATARKLNAGEILPVTVTGKANIPTDAEAVSFNLTATNTTGPGFITVWPCGSPRPMASNLNFSSGVDVANLVTSRVGSEGRVCLYSPASTDVIMDAQGYFDAAAGPRAVFTPLDPQRVLDTQDGTGVANRRVGPLGARQVIAVEVAGVNGVPSDARSVVLNVTITDSRGPGWAAVLPCGHPLPNVSNVNFVRGVDRANAVKVKVGFDGKVCIYTSTDTQLIADQFGYFAVPV